MMRCFVIPICLAPLQAVPQGLELFTGSVCLSPMWWLTPVPSCDKGSQGKDLVTLNAGWGELIQPFPSWERG